MIDRNFLKIRLYNFEIILKLAWITVICFCTFVHKATNLWVSLISFLKDNMQPNISKWDSCVLLSTWTYHISYVHNQLPHFPSTLPMSAFSILAAIFHTMVKWIHISYNKTWPQSKYRYKCYDSIWIVVSKEFFVQKIRHLQLECTKIDRW